MNEFKATECIKFGWETFKKRPWYLVGVTILYTVAAFVLSFISGVIEGFGVASGASALGHILGFVISLLLNTFLSLAMIMFLLKAHDDIEHVAVSDALHFEDYWKFVGAYILMMLAIIGGLILLIVRNNSQLTRLNKFN